MTTNKKKLLLPITMAKAGWDVLIGRDDIEAVPYEPYITMPDLQAALRDTDGIALSLTPLKAPEIAVADRLRVAARIGVGFDAVEVPALTARGIPLMVVGTANSVCRRSWSAKIAGRIAGRPCRWISPRRRC